MIQWKQRLYAFLLRRVLGPFLDASEATKLHDSIAFSLQEGTFALKDISLDAAYLTEILAAKGSGISIRRAKIERLEIMLTLRENSHDKNQGEDAPQSSLAWRAMKLGTTSESLPAVSLIAEIKLHGLDLELEPSDWRRQRPAQVVDDTATSEPTSKPTSKSTIGSYVDAALSSLQQLNLKLTNIDIKLCHREPRRSCETWVSVRLSSVTYKDLDVNVNNDSSSYKTVLNKSLDFSEITIQAGERQLKEAGALE
jgi:hypothetical protein